MGTDFEDEAAREKLRAMLNRQFGIGDVSYVCPFTRAACWSSSLDRSRLMHAKYCTTHVLVCSDDFQQPLRCKLYVATLTKVRLKGLNTNLLCKSPPCV